MRKGYLLVIAIIVAVILVVHALNREDITSRITAVSSQASYVTFLEGWPPKVERRNIPYLCRNEFTPNYEEKELFFSKIPYCLRKELSTDKRSTRYTYKSEHGSGVLLVDFTILYTDCAILEDQQARCNLEQFGYKGVELNQKIIKFLKRGIK